MSKNSTEVLIELFIEENQKLKKSLQQQQQLNEEFINAISKAGTFEINSDRLEEVIKYWNELFNKQKAQILTLQETKIKTSTSNESKIFKSLILIIALLIIILFYLIWN